MTFKQFFFLFSDGYRSKITEIPSYHSGNANLTISISRPESNIGELAKVQCPCGNVTLGDSIYIPHFVMKATLISWGK